jgi:hypothetical protein
MRVLWLAKKCPEDFMKGWGFMGSIFASLEGLSSEMTFKKWS